MNLHNSITWCDQAALLSNGRCLSTLIIAEHNGESLTKSTLNAVTAAKAIGGEITALVAGSNASKVCTTELAIYLYMLIKFD